jgi:hypothetical protein
MPKLFITCVHLKPLPQTTTAKVRMQELHTALAHAEHMLMRVGNRRTHTEHMPSMSLQAADFDNPAVANAINPSAYGYHHGKHMHNAL